MKFLMVSVILVCLVSPVFSQDTNTQRYKSLSDSMGTTVTNCNTKLEDFDQRSTYNGNGKTYARYSQRFDSLNKVLRDCEIRLEHLVQGRAPATTIKEERDKYEDFIKQLDSLKNEYDEWLKSVQ